MAHNLHGDVPQEHLQLAEELEELEIYLESNSAHLPKEKVAKGYVCLASDWYSMGDEDMGRSLLDKASKICPTYFDKELDIDVKEDPVFETLILNLTSNILNVLGGLIYQGKK
jgi:hypothetical protein